MNNIQQAIAQSAYPVCKVRYELDKALEQVISPGKVKFLNDYGEQDVYSRVFEKATYLDLAVFVNEQIHLMKDDHHVFLEDVYLHSVENEGQPEEVKIYTYALGS